MDMDHMQMGGTHVHDAASSAMSMSLMPRWVQVLGAAVFLLVVANHVRHAIDTRGQARGWHGTHVIMAAAMVAMFALPTMQHPGLSRAGVAVFAVLAVALAATTVLAALQDGVVNTLWLAATLDAVAMVVMFLPMDGRPAALAYAFAGYLLLQTVAWTGGLYDRLPSVIRARSSLGSLATEPPVPSAAVGGGVVAFTAHSTLAMRATLAVMALGMAYMLVAMAG